MKKSCLTILSFFLTVSLYAQQQVPEATELYVDVEKVKPAEGTNAPSDAIVLFDGSNLEMWQSAQPGIGAGSMIDLKG